jgi:hypothetical protein
MSRLDGWLPRSRRLWLWIALGIALRLLLIWFPRPTDDDTTDYLTLGHNLLHYGVYGQGPPDDLSPTLFRLPAYPIILASFELIFARIWPSTWMTTVLIAQAIADIGSGLLLAAFARRFLSPRGGEIALALAMLCPFTAAFAGIALTECFSVFALSLGIYAIGRALASDRIDLCFTLLAGAASAFAVLLRPDGVLQSFALGAGILWYSTRTFVPALGRNRAASKGIATALIYCCAALLPMVPWIARNWITFHVFQPLAPRHLNDPGERFNKGFYDWLRTWSTEFSTTSDVFWQVGSAEIDEDSIPTRAFDSPDQRSRTLALIAAYNEHHDISSALDDKFEALAEERIRNHPVQCFVVVPALRVADMLLRPRTLEFGLDVDWWEWSAHSGQTIAAIALGLINLAYVLLAVWGFIRGRVPFAWMLGGYLLLRCLLLGTMENPEPRYTIQMFPILIVAAAAAFAKRSGPGGAKQAMPQAAAQITDPLNSAVRQSSSGPLRYAR